MEKSITLDELSHSLKKMKNNKTPGSDGFPVEFFKVFWNKLIFFVFRSLQESYQTSLLPLTMRQCIISCLPKGNKNREYLKNWRPISLLNVTYKLCSSVIANRIKEHLDIIISNTQTGFISNRFIGESTRLVYDLMNICEKKNITGLLMLIDFEKAFDSVSWRFLMKVLCFFNFGPNIQKWITLLNSNITAAVQQCGYLSEFFNIERGCRQGDPISAYLFIICAQLLYLMIFNNKDIKGIFIENNDPIC